MPCPPLTMPPALPRSAPCSETPPSPAGWAVLLGLDPSLFSQNVQPHLLVTEERQGGHAPWVYSKPISCLYVQLPLLSQTELAFATETLARTGNILATECPLCIPPAPHPLLTHTPQPANLGALDKLSGACARCRDGQGLQHTHLQG